MINRRAKGVRNEKRSRDLDEAQGAAVFWIHQPQYAKQGALDHIAIYEDRIVLVQTRSNRAGDIRPIKALKVWPTVKVVKEVRVFVDRVKEPIVRRF